jgi:hypothetical protein
VRLGLGLVGSAVWLGVVGCGDGGTAPLPDNDGRRLAGQFERLADSVDGGGYSPTAEALRHAAEIVRLTGHATPVTLTIDGASRNFLAIAEQIDFPNLECSWPSDSGFVEPGDTIVVPPADSTGVVLLSPEPPQPLECHVVGTYSMRTLTAWEPENMAEVVRVVASIGSNGVETGMPDVMTGLPTRVVAIDPFSALSPAEPPDSGSGSGGEPGGFPGFMGEYLVRDVGSWWAVEGSQANDLAGLSGDCTDDRTSFDWAEFSCEAARFRFGFSMRVDALRYEPLTGVADPPGGPEGSHTLALGSTSVDGVRLTVIDWAPPPLPPDSAVAMR